MTRLLAVLATATLTLSASAQIESGPMVGHTTSDAGSLWAYDSDAEELGVVWWRKGDQPREGERAVLRRANAGSPVLRHAFRGLDPDTAYAYRVRAAGREPVEGSFTTAPAPGEPARFSYLVTSCMNPHQWPAQPAWDEVLRQDPAFHLLLGDNVYSDSTDHDTILRHHLRQRAIPNFAGVLATTPSYANWDDHDFGPNDSHGGTPGKENSLRAFREVWANPSYGLPDLPGVFFSFSWADVDFFFVDGRYHRTDEHADVPDKTQFGLPQLAWLQEGLRRSDATFKVVATGYDVMGGRYPDEAKRIGAVVRDSGATGVLFHSGDIHRNEFKQQNHGAGYPITQITSSGIARHPKRPWAMIDVDTTIDDPTITARFFVEEKLDVTHLVKLSDLSPR